MLDQHRPHLRLEEVDAVGIRLRSSPCAAAATRITGRIRASPIHRSRWVGRTARPSPILDRPLRLARWCMIPFSVGDVKHLSNIRAERSPSCQAADPVIAFDAYMHDIAPRGDKTSMQPGSHLNNPGPIGWRVGRIGPCRSWFPMSLSPKCSPLVRQLLEIIRLQQERIQQLEDPCSPPAGAHPATRRRDHRSQGPQGPTSDRSQHAGNAAAATLATRCPTARLRQAVQERPTDDRPRRRPSAPSPAHWLSGRGFWG